VPPPLDPALRARLLEGLVIPACPLALDAQRRLDERRQRGLLRYYAAAGAGGVAIGVHTTQFAIRDPAIGLFRPLLALAEEELGRIDARSRRPLLRIGGICGGTRQALAEAAALRELGWHAGLVSLAELRDAGEDALIAHCGAVGEVLPIIGFYLQPAVGGRVLSYSFWRRFAELESAVAVKIAPFNRYRTIEVVRAVAESGREDLALYTGNDDQIVVDLLTPFRFRLGDGSVVERRIAGGLLGHWAVWTRNAVGIHTHCRAIAAGQVTMDARALLRLAAEVTDANAAFFDAANGFAGCIAGLHEVLRRQGLLERIDCLDPRETLGPGQLEEIDRVLRAYPHLSDDDFVRANLAAWLAD
jgi:hypothetical protein